MDWKQFFASVAGAIAWPVAVLVIVIMFRKQIRWMLEHLKRIGGPGVNFELSREIDEAQASIEKLAVETKPSQEIINIDAKGFQEKYEALQVAAVFPAGAILFAWKEIEGIIGELKLKLDPNKPYRNPEEVLKALINEGFLSETILHVYRNLKKVRNTIVHTPDAEKMPRGEVMELLGQLGLVANVLRAAGEQLNEKPR
jgi:hypothetical protein